MALMLVLAVLAGIVWGVWALASHFAAAGEAAPPAPTAPAASDPPEEPSSTADPDETEGPEDPEVTPNPEAEPEVGPCVDGNIQVVAVTDATSYRSGVLPKLSIELSNTGSVACTMNVGSSQQSFTITSGRDVWWRSTDCQSESSEMIVTLEAGQKVSTQTPIEWRRERSSVSTCESDSRPRAPGGGASYHLAVSIGGFDSARTKQFFLY